MSSIWTSNDIACLLNPLGHGARRTGSGPPRGARFDARALRLRERDARATGVGPEIVRDVVPEFAPDFQRVSVHEGSHAPAAVEARKFRARAARLVAANYTHRFAACDTSRFYPNATRK